MSKWFRGFLMLLAKTGCISLIEDESVSARDRMRFARWLRALNRKEETGPGVIRVDREGIAYVPEKRVVLKAKH